MAGTQRSTTRVFVGLSGGVDSAVSAALLQEQGYDVTGVFIRTWHPDGFPCTEPEDEREAMRVAAHLGIPFRTLDLRERYKREVAQQMIDGYARGETPNPDVLCNREVKFGGFVEYAQQKGAHFVATGHYARTVQSTDGALLAQGLDPAKDQSYFLALVPREQMAKVLFPIGDLTKAKVRALAKRFRLPNAARKDSQGICFLGALDLRAFLSAFIPLVEGTVLSLEGQAIGTHAGAALYTVGERHGFHVEATSAHTEPLYVLSTDIERNTITVGFKSALVGSTKITLRSVVMHQDIPVGQVDAQVRYHGALTRVTAEKVATDSVFLTSTHGIVVARGQTVVLYHNDQVILAGVVSALS
jgi:tRNA-specific 2-thiouridylase